MRKRTRFVLAASAALGLLVGAACRSTDVDQPTNIVGPDAEAGPVDEAGADAPDDVIDASTAKDADAGDADASDADAGIVIDPPIVHVVPGVVVETFAGSGSPGNLDGVGSGAQFSNPVGVALTPDGILVVEYDGGRVRLVNPLGSTSLVASGFSRPFGIISAPDGFFLQTDDLPDGGASTTSGTIWRVPTNGTPQVVASGFGRPRGIVRLPDGRLVLADRQLHTLTILNPTNGVSTLLAGAAGSAGFADGIGGAARFNAPYGIALLPDGSIVVADQNNHCLRRVTLAGEVTLFAGDRVIGIRDDVDKLKARFFEPKDVTADTNGDVYITDTGACSIRRILASGAVETVAGDGTPGFADGAGTAAKFFGQEQLDVTADGKTIYVSDGSGGEKGKPYHRLRRITLP